MQRLPARPRRMPDVPAATETALVRHVSREEPLGGRDRGGACLGLGRVTDLPRTTASPGSCHPTKLVTPCDKNP